MNYTPTNNPQRFMALPKGTYEAELINFEDNLTSSKGSDMSKLFVKVYGEGTDVRVIDYLVNLESMQWKIKDFMQATGQTYGEPIDFEKAKGKLFKVILKEEEYNGQIQNKIDTYVLYEKPIEAVGKDVKDSDLPF